MNMVDFYCTECGKIFRIEETDNSYVVQSDMESLLDDGEIIEVEYEFRSYDCTGICPQCYEDMHVNMNYKTEDK